MKLRAFLICVLLFSPTCYGASGNPYAAAGSNSQGSADRVYDVLSFAAELRRLDAALQGNPSAVKIAEFRKALPLSWNVSTPEQTYSISTKPLQDQLGGSSTLKAETWIEHLQVEIERSHKKAVTSVSAKTELDKILGGREFAGVRPPSAWDLLRQRIAAWIGRMLAALFGNISRHPIGAQILFWLLLIGGVAFVALWVFRFVSNRDGVNSFKPHVLNRDGTHLAGVDTNGPASSYARRFSRISSFRLLGRDCAPGRNRSVTPRPHQDAAGISSSLECVAVRSSQSAAELQ
jgi:hypothetical protein